MFPVQEPVRNNLLGPVNSQLTQADRLIAAPSAFIQVGHTRESEGEGGNGSCWSQQLALDRCGAMEAVSRDCAL